MEEVNAEKAEPRFSLFINDRRNGFTESGGYGDVHGLQSRECGLLNLHFFHALVAVVEAYDNLVCR